MGESPIFTCSAHVFTIDPQTKKNWLLASNSAVDVSFYFDPNNESYRIVSIEETESAGKKIVIHSTITEKMSFRKTSQKFGQWADNKKNVVYGLGFSNEAEVDKFVEQFTKVVEETKKNSAKKSSPQNNFSGISGLSSNGNIAVNILDHQIQPSTTSPALQTPAASVSFSNSSNVDLLTNFGGEDMHPGGQMPTVSSLVVDHSPAGSATASSANTSAMDVLRTENDMFKLQLSQSNANNKKLEVELSTLRRNNADLVRTLQESGKNVEEWKKTVQAYSEECQRLRTAAEGAANMQSVTAQLNTLRLTRDQDLQRLEVAERDKAILVERVKTLEAELRTSKQRTDEANSLAAEVNARLTDTVTAHQKLQQLLARRL